MQFTISIGTYSLKTSVMIQTYNEVARWGQRTDREANLDDFVIADDEKIKWSRNLKRELKAKQN